MFKRSDNGSTQVHWSKDFVEHLRTVHFTLVAVSVALILIISRTSSPSLEQIRQIIELKKEWPPTWIPFLHPDTQRYAGEHKDLDYQNIVWTNPVPTMGDISWRNGKKTETVDFSFDPWFVDTQEYNWAHAQFPSTLEGFHAWWKELESKHRVYIPMNMYKGTVYVNYGESTEKIVGNVTIVGQDLASKSKHRVIQLGTVRVLPEIDFRYEGSDGPYYLKLPVRVAVIDIDQEIISTGFKGWKPGPYEKSFASLAQEARELEAEDLEQVEKVISERLANRTEQFEAFGMKFPINQVTQWGTIVVISVQLYFLLYLLQLSGRLRADDPGWDTPWICMNQALMAQIVSFITVVLLPVVAVSLLSARGSLHLTAGYWTPDSWHLLVKLRDWDWTVRLQVAGYVVASLTAFGLAIASWVSRPRLKVEAEPRCSAQLFE